MFVEPYGGPASTNRTGVCLTTTTTHQIHLPVQLRRSATHTLSNSPGMHADAILLVTPNAHSVLCAHFCNDPLRWYTLQSYRPSAFTPASPSQLQLLRPRPHPCLQVWPKRSRAHTERKRRVRAYHRRRIPNHRLGLCPCIHWSLKGGARSVLRPSRDRRWTLPRRCAMLKPERVQRM